MASNTNSNSNSNSNANTKNQKKKKEPMWRMSSIVMKTLSSQEMKTVNSRWSIW